MAVMGISSLGLDLEELLIGLHPQGTLALMSLVTFLRMFFQLSTAAREGSRMKLAVFIMRKDCQERENLVSHLGQVSTLNLAETSKIKIELVQKIIKSLLFPLPPPPPPTPPSFNHSFYFW